MAACTNNGRSKARSVVTAALVGVLSVGAVPMVALATGTTDGVETLVNAGEDSFANSTVVTNLSSDQLGNLYVQANASGVEVGTDIMVSSVTLQGAKTPLDSSAYSWKVWKVDEDGTKTGSVQYGSEISQPGSYVIEITYTAAEYKDQVKTVPFTVKPASFDNITFKAYEVNPYDSADKSDADFMYTGSELNVGIVANNSDGTFSGLLEGVDYEVKILKAGSNAGDPAATVEDAGTYYAVVKGLGQYANYEDKTDNFEVVPFDFSTATIYVEDQTSSTYPTTPTKVYQNDSSAYAGTELDPSLVSLKPNDVWGNGNGRHQFTVTYDSSNKNLKGGTDGVINAYANVNKVGTIASFTYKGEAVQDSYTIDKSKGESFDTSKLLALAGEKELTRNDDFIIDVKNLSNTSDPDAGSSLRNNSAGVYEVSIITKPGSGALTDYSYGGRKTFTVNVIKGVVDADAQVYVSLGDKVITSYTKQYDGKTLSSSDFKVTVYDKNNNEITSTVNPTIKLLDSANNDVTSSGITNAGTYTLEVSASGYELTGTTKLTISVTKVDLTKLKVGALKTWPTTADGAEYLPMAASYVDGKKVTKDAEYPDIASFDLQFMQDGNWVDMVSGTNVTFAIDETIFSVEKWDDDKGEWVKQSPNYCMTAGNYRIVLRGDESFAKNYQLADESNNTTTVEFKVVDLEQLEFTDVTPDSPFFNCIDWMYDEGYVKGYANTTLFGQDNAITRADVAVILYRMAEGTPAYDVDLGYSETRGWESGFDDVDGNMYYAKAIGWAKATGVVHGYDDTHFGPNDNITREQLATMLANFAKVAYGADVELDEDALASMPDGDQVSEYAEKAVSWAVDNGLMGNGGSISPLAEITRGETAAMGYNYLTKVVGMANTNADA